MKWLNPDQMRSFRPVPAERQTLVLFCETDRLDRAIPVEPRLLSTDDGAPSPTHQWVGLIENGLPLVLEQPIGWGTRDLRGVTLHTQFPGSSSGRLGDWSILPLLARAELPQPIHALRPLYVQSRSASSEYVVYRHHPNGWDDPVYQAANASDAQEFITFLEQDDWNASCFIGKREPPAEWGIFDASSAPTQVLGCYPDLNVALRFAHDWSREHPQVLTVKDISAKAPSRQFRVASGHVQRAREEFRPR